MRLMETSFASTLPWIWIIEALPCYNQLDATILHDLVKKAPEMFSDLGKNTRELVFLRILEQFVIGAQNANPVSSSLSFKIGFDPSQSSEDQKMSLSAYHTRHQYRIRQLLDWTH